MEKYVCIHGHFYQPPRENPWLEEVELQDSAYPYHDWNDRITAECYGTNAASRILDNEKRVIGIINNYSKMSFNFGPTLLSWMAKHQPVIYEAILEADKLSMKKFSGHGSAMAQVYNHMILPLANHRDKASQINWGLYDFKKRFGRETEGIWLPETAVDTESLEMLAERGVLFTVLAPHQARRVKPLSGGEWAEVKNGQIDTTRAYRCVLPSGKTINLFFYDGNISHEVAFGDLLNNGENFARRLLGVLNREDEPQISNIATDGETYGHHHQFGEMALTYCLHFIESNNLARLTNYGEYLEKHPPQFQAEILENSSWSCAHGVERWRDNCGCNSGMHPGWTQEWRKPLREALNWLRDYGVILFVQESAKLFKDPWQARDRYIEVILDRNEAQVDKFLQENALKELTRDEKTLAMRLMEMQRNAMLMFTSCGWFFDEISGIETVQVMQYAARVMHLIEEIQGVNLEGEFVKDLEKAPSNLVPSGAKAYEMYAKPAMADLFRVGAHYAITALFSEGHAEESFCYRAKQESYFSLGAGRSRLAIGKSRIMSQITLNEEVIDYAVLHLGDHNINAGVRKFKGDAEFTAMKEDMQNAYEKGDVSDVIRLMDKHFGYNNYSISHLFTDEQRKIINQILQMTYDEIEDTYRHIYEDNYAIMNFFQSLRIPLPSQFFVSIEEVVNRDLKKLFDTERIDTARLEKLIKEAQKWNLKVGVKALGFVASGWINNFMKKIKEHSENTALFNEMQNILRLLRSINLELNLWEAQNIYYEVWQEVYKPTKLQADCGDSEAKKWVKAFESLGLDLKIKVVL